MASEGDVKMEVEEGVKPSNGTENKKKPVEASPAKAAQTQAHYRVKVSGLPRFYTPSDPLLISFKKFLTELGLEVKYIRSPKKGNSWLYITFFNQQNQEKALKLLKHYVWKDRTLICTLVVADVLKRKQEECGPESAKRIKLDIPLEEQMLMATIPYHAVSYEEQISKKNEEAQCLFKWLTECMEKKNPQLIGYIDQQVAKNTKTKVPFDLHEVRKATLIDGYRNKCEFRIAMEPDTKKIVIGYRVDNQVDEMIAVAPPDALRHLPREMINLCKAFEQFVQESKYEPQKMNHDEGVWRSFHVRINKEKQMLVVVLINPTILDDNKLKELKLQLIYYFSRGAASKANGHNVVSLYIHMDPDLKVPGGGDKHKRPAPTGVMEHIWGEPNLVEQLLDLKLDINPNFYFQNNTYGAEELYKAVNEVTEVDKDTIILDLCCGSGGMGMTFANRCKQVIGVEVMDENVSDAKRLAEKNGLTNCEFLQGAVDDLLPQLEEKLKGQKVIPILDPPRIGISVDLIKWLRKFTEVERIIYVCSNHKMPTKNILDLASKNGEHNEFTGTTPFFPKTVIPVDISPHSLRCELVILLERLDMKKVPKPTREPKSTYFKEKGPRGLLFHDNCGRAGLKKGQRQVRSRGLGRGRLLPRGMMRRGHSAPLRETMYPLPLREHLYPRGRRLMPPSALPPPRPNPYSGPMGLRPRRDFEYSDFRRDFEDAIDSYEPPRRGPFSQRLAMANAMLEKGMRLAEEAMAEDYSYPDSARSYIGRRGSSSLATRGRMGMDEMGPSSLMGMNGRMAMGARARMGMDDEMGPPSRMGRNRMAMGPQSGMGMEIDDRMGPTSRMAMGVRARMMTEMEDEMEMGVRPRMGATRGRGVDASGRLGMSRNLGGFSADTMGFGGGYGLGSSGRYGMEANSWGGQVEENWTMDPQNSWQSSWDGDDNYEIIPPRSAIQPQRAGRRGMRGSAGVTRARGTRGQGSGNFWRN